MVQGSAWLGRGTTRPISLSYLPASLDRFLDVLLSYKEPSVEIAERCGGETVLQTFGWLACLLSSRCCKSSVSYNSSRRPRAGISVVSFAQTDWNILSAVPLGFWCSEGLVTWSVIGAIRISHWSFQCSSLSLIWKGCFRWWVDTRAAEYT